jgi:hypothetical protein
MGQDTILQDETKRRPDDGQGVTPKEKTPPGVIRQPTLALSRSSAGPMASTLLRGPGRPRAHGLGPGRWHRRFYDRSASRAMKAPGSQGLGDCPGDLGQSRPW